MRLVLFGSGEFGLPTFEALAREHEIRLVVTQPDRAAGRGGKITPTAVGAWAEANLGGVEIIKAERVNEESVRERIRGESASAWVVIAFGQKLGRRLVEGRFAINLHGSLLPRWRGAAPIHHAILAGDRVSGVSVITIADRMDAGEVLGCAEMEVPACMTAGELHDALARLGPGVVLRVLRDFEAGRLSRTPQDETRVTMAPRLTRADAWVDWSQEAEACRRRINGLSPWPGVSVDLSGVRLRLLRAEVVAGRRDAPPGTVLDARAGHVACGGGTMLRLLEVQPAGGRAMSWEEFANGHRVEAGVLLTGRNE